MKKVVLIGLGAVGLTYAVKLKNKCDLRILVDEERLVKYKNNKPVFNGVEQDFDYILPSDKLDTDLIIIAVKSYGLVSAINCLNNFVSKKTRIISLINGISSEEIISKTYPNAKVLKSYFIGHSAVRKNNYVIQDGVGKIIVEKDSFLENFFSEVGIDYVVPDDIDYSMWLKYTFNLFSNQVSAILKMNFGQLKQNENFKNFAKNVINEVRQIAEYKGIKNLNKLESDALNSLDLMCDDGKTSMLQDIIAMRPTEVDIFAGEIIRLGEQYGIATPYNKILYELIKIKEEDNERCIHTC